MPRLVYVVLYWCFMITECTQFGYFLKVWLFSLKSFLFMLNVHNFAFKFYES